jgi:putative oxidoreductase
MATSSISTPPSTATSGLVPTRWTDLILLALRVVVGLMYACHGAQKLFGWFGGPGGNGGSVPLASMFGLAGLLECGGGLLIALGLFTRATAFVLAGEMAVAYFLVHARGGLFPIVNKGESAVLYCFVFLTLWAVGPGAYSLDARRGLVRAGR